MLELKNLIVWAKDSSQFVLLGRQFYVVEGARLTNGESLYLLYDIRSGQLWCNANQQDKAENFSPKNLDGIAWGGTLW